MWSAITKIFTKYSDNSAQSGKEQAANMDRSESRRLEVDVQDSYDTTQAKQRAAVKWLLSKAFNNKVPENLSEPFYRDYENQEHLKPHIVGALANAEMYCLALGNIYSDPNYHNLNHWAILQTLARKGVYVSEPSNSQLTETTLIQTNPLRMSAHMAVIESIMVLYAKEVVTPDRVLAAIQRFNHGVTPPPPMPDTHEQGLLMWVNHTCEALKKKIDQESNIGVTNGGEGDRLRSPNFRPVKDFKALCDGVALAALISYYCPDELPWTDLKISNLSSVSESLYNLGLVQDFCDKCLPSSVFHMMPEDVTYIRGSMKQNLIVFLADLFNVLEIHPAKCVRYPGMDRTAAVSRSTPTHVPLRKTNSFQQGTSEMSEDSLRRDSDESFVVHRGKNIPTLSSVIQDEPLTPARLRINKEKQNNDTKADERGDSKAAGKPSNWNEQKKPSFAGRRSRRNSMSDDSQLTIENFGGSQDNLNFIGKNPDKEVAVHIGRKISAPCYPVPIENPAVRSSIQDARGSIQLGYDNGCEKADAERENQKLKKQISSEDISLCSIINSQNKENIDIADGDISSQMSFAELSRQKSLGENRGINLIYMQQDKEDLPTKSSFLNKAVNQNTNGEKKTTSFATLPNTTTWQQQSNIQNVDNTTSQDSNSGNQITASQLNDIRLKLEEKRRHIETDKRKMEVAMNKQRQKVGKAAFLQAVVKEISDDASNVENKWLIQESPPFVETRRTPDVENMNVDQYQHSMAKMNCSLQDIQADIQRLSNQQKQIHIAQELAAQQKQLYQHYQHPQFLTQQPYATQQYQQAPIYAPLQTSASAPHIPQSLYQTQSVANQSQFFLHNQQPQLMQMQSHQQLQQPVIPQRRTWAQAQPLQTSNDSYQQPEMRTWGKPQNTGGFVLHDTSERYQERNTQQYHNGSDHSLNHSNSHPGFTLSQQHQLYSGSQNTPSASPQHKSVHRQISQLMDDNKRSPISLQQIEPVRKSSITHAPIPAPPVDDMAPQSISFIGNPDEEISKGLSRLNITSGTRTYRIPSPTRPLISHNAFQPSPTLVREGSVPEVSCLDDDLTNQKGFYVSFNDEQPKRPKPPLRMKKMSPKKERSYVESSGEPDYEQIREMLEKQERTKQLERELEQDGLKREVDERRNQEFLRKRKEACQERDSVAAVTSAIVIGNDLSNPDPDLMDEKEKKKERIMLLSLQRRQQQEELKQRKEQEAQARREREKAKEEEKIRKKEEQAQRRATILEQYKLKKAIDEAERDGRDIDKALLGSLKPTPKMRPRGLTRPRPKTIHIDSGSVEMAEGMLQPSRGKKGSNSNLTVYNPSSMKRDYYRGSQDSLAGSGMLYNRDSTDDSRGMSPCHSANQTLGRRSSYKTSRGSSTDQDSIAYRYGDTDSGLGRATPPRRAPSPGMGPMRHLPSPSGPGSLPGLMSKRRVFDDAASDISSTPSSMMDYSGPRLYKQPTTKSNRGIMLNAVEYCVFPGAVNKEAKQRVLEEIARSESKHFLILFRDAGCQFRALYSYCPDREEVMKLYGTGPKQVNDRMFDKFFKYNSGGKCFSQVHTKHLTVTIDAFTIHNSLWQGKKVNLPNKKDMALVI